MVQSCNKCRETKPLVAFGIDRSRASGINAICKECVRARLKECLECGQTKQHTDFERYSRNCKDCMAKPTKQCLTCRQFVPREHFYAHNSFSQNCKTCRRAVEKERALKKASSLVLQPSSASIHNWQVNYLAHVLGMETSILKELLEQFNVSIMH